MVDFFANARTIGSRALSALNLADKSTSYTTRIGIDKLFEQAIKDIYKQYSVETQGVASPVSKPLFDITNKTLQGGIDSAFSTEFGKTDPEFINQFKTNAAVFSAFKSHAQQNEIVAQLIDEKGDLRSFDKFRKTVLNGTTIKQDYSINWLKTEYNMAVRSARMAEKLKGYERTAHLYPNLKYLPSTAANPRDTHKHYYDPNSVILPIGHPWWTIHMPPSDWGCECDVENTDEPVTGVPEGGGEVDPVFANNPAETAEFLNIDEHPYKKYCSESVKDDIIITAKNWMQKSQASLDREKYLAEMQILKSKVVEKTAIVENETKTIQVKFTKDGNKHLYSDTFSRAKGILEKEELKNLDKILEKATFVKPAKLSKVRKDNIVGFYYYEAKINGKTCYLNVAEKEVMSKGRMRKTRFLYSVTKWIK